MYGIILNIVYFVVREVIKALSIKILTLTVLADRDCKAVAFIRSSVNKIHAAINMNFNGPAVKFILRSTNYIIFEHGTRARPPGVSL